MENERLLSERLLSVDEMHADCKMKPLGELLISQDAKTMAARDKWWIKTLELNCGDGHDKPLITIGVQEWQDFKQSILEVEE